MFKNYWGGDRWSVTLQENRKSNPTSPAGAGEAAVRPVWVTEPCRVFLESRMSKQCHVLFWALASFLHKPVPSKRSGHVYKISAAKPLVLLTSLAAEVMLCSPLCCLGGKKWRATCTNPTGVFRGPLLWDGGGAEDAWGTWLPRPEGYCYLSVCWR